MTFCSQSRHATTALYFDFLKPVTDGILELKDRYKNYVKKHKTKHRLH